MLPKILNNCRSQLGKSTFFKVSFQRRFLLSLIKHYSSRADYRMAPHVFRQKKLYTAEVIDIADASSTIKVLRLYVKDVGFAFKAGQWVDFYVPGMQDVTGYSMTSAPNEAKETGILELSVKYGKFPPTHWVHNHCLPGQKVQIRVGGDFFYDPLSKESEAQSNLLLIGGGVGINPLVSILLEYRDLLLSSKLSSLKPGKVHLLYSARTDDELVFKDTFDKLENEFPTLSCQYFVTKPQSANLNPSYHYSRIKEKDVANSISELKLHSTLCYICGPSTMTDEVASWLLKLGVKQEHIRYEKWW